MDDGMKWIMRTAIAALLAATGFFLMRVVERQDQIASNLNSITKQQIMLIEQVRRLEKEVEENREGIKRVRRKLSER